MTDPRDIYGTRLSDRMMMPNRVTTGSMGEVPIPTLQVTLTSVIAALEEHVAELESVANEISLAIRGPYPGGVDPAERAAIPTDRVARSNERIVRVREELHRVLEAIR